MFTNILFFGAGAAGSNTLLNIVRDLPTVNVGIVDYDKIEMRNIITGTQPYGRSDLNKFKTQVLSMNVYSNTKDGTRLSTLNKKIESQDDIKLALDLFKDGSTLIVDCFDNSESRNLLYNAKDPRIFDILHIGFSEQLSGEVCWNDIWTPMTEIVSTFDICTSQGARSFIITLTGLASTIISDYYFNNKKRNIYFDRTLNLKIF